MIYLLMILMVIVAAFLIRNILIMIFSMENYNIHKKRLNQLKFEEHEEKEDDLAGFVDKVTKPIIKHVFSRFTPKNLEALEKDLKMSQWDKYFTPLQFRALSLLLKVISVVVVILLWKKAAFLAIIWGAILFIGIDVLHYNAKKNRAERLMTDFPDFMRVMESFLSAGLPFTKAVEESIKYVGPDWQPILKKFVVKADVKSVTEALDGLRDDVDLIAVREFVAMVRLTIEQGGEAKESFSRQADKIREMQQDAIAIKIGKRETMGVLLTFPLLLAVIAVMGLPVVGAMMDFTAIQ